MAVHPEDYQDTDPRAMEVWIEMQRRMTPGEKLARALDLSNLAVKLSEAGVRLAYPAADEREVFLRAAARRLSRDLMIRAYGWDPESDGNAG